MRQEIWNGFQPMNRVQVTVACLRAAVEDLRSALEAAETCEQAWDIYEEAVEVEERLAGLATAAAQKDHLLGSLGLTAPMGRAS